jgi:hypothetical protein
LVVTSVEIINRLVALAMQILVIGLAFFVCAAHGRTQRDEAVVDKMDPQKALALLALANHPGYQKRMDRRAAIAKSAGVAAATLATAAHANSIQGVNGALDFGPLGGDQPGGEGTGKALGIDNDYLYGVLFAIPAANLFYFAQWQRYQGDDDDFFDTYDSRRVDGEESARNRF